MDVLLAIDQGTTSSRCVAFDLQGNAVALARREFAQHFPHDGWVEHDPEDIWHSTLACLAEVTEALAAAGHVAIGVGMANQRETTLVWDRRTGEAVSPAIVWQDRRTAALCEELRSEGIETRVSARTGLLLDPYFSATKLAWILEQIPGCRARAEAGELAFGTVDSFLLWRLSAGTRHCTDATNAARTMLFDIHAQRWDEELLARLRIPRTLLPEVLDCTSGFVRIAPGLPGAGLAVAGVAGDQQAALIGQGCLRPGEAKATYGTGGFLMLNTGAQPVTSHNRLLTTLAWRIDGVATYALEGSIFVAGAVIKWLRDMLGLIASAPECEAAARRTGYSGGVYLVPAFAGLGAPHWDPHARGAIVGLTRDSGRDAIVSAALQSVAYQTRDVLDAMAADGPRLDVLRVDGGMAVNDWLLQFLADMLGMVVSRPHVTEATALGAASLAGFRLGVLPTLDHFAAARGEERRFVPRMAQPERERLYAGWLDAVRRVRS